MQKQHQYPVEKMCRALKISKNAYYNWCKSSSKPPGKSLTALLKKRIRTIFDESHQTYGSPRITAALERKYGIKLSRSYVARLMKAMGIRSVVAKKFVVTTDSKHSHPVASNIVNRNFTVKELGQVWVSDITYIRCGSTWKYLTTIIDLCDRNVVGWSLSHDLTTKHTVLKAWQMAKAHRSIQPGFILHSDQGVQFASFPMKTIFQYNLKAKQSMSRKGNCWDNAVAESFFKTIKYEMINRKKYADFWRLYHDIERYINWYNTERLHSSLGYKTPLEKQVEIMNKYYLKTA